MAGTQKKGFWRRLLQVKQLRIQEKRRTYVQKGGRKGEENAVAKAPKKELFGAYRRNPRCCCRPFFCVFFAGVLLELSLGPPEVGGDVWSATAHFLLLAWLRYKVWVPNSQKA